MKKKLFILSCLAAMIVILCFTVYRGRNSCELEGDEVFSYISATSQGGFKGICFLDDQTWYPREYFSNAVAATGTERFNMPMVWKNQAMDTHPPLYYAFLNVVCSVAAGKFSPWFGIGLNIFLLFAVWVGLMLLLQYFLKNQWMSLCFSTLYCCSAFSTGMVAFVRMYILLTAFVVFQSWIHLKLYDRINAEDKQYEIKRHWKSYVTLMLVTLGGALTHYYFLIYQFLIAALLVVGLWLKKRYRDIARYVGVMLVSGIIFIAVYPAALHHIFFKYRGREAVHKFFKEDSVFGSVKAMLKLFNKEMFKGKWIVLLVILLLALLIAAVRGNIVWREQGKMLLLIMPALIYFFCVSKASPYVTLRYVSPVAPLIYAFFAVEISRLIYAVDMSGRYGKCLKYAGYAVAGMLLSVLVLRFGKTSAKSAYFAERREVVETLAKEAECCVYVTGDEYNWKMWEDYVNYPIFKGLFFIDGRKMDPIENAEVREQEKLVVYIDKALDEEEITAYLMTYLNVTNFTKAYETPYTYIMFAD